MPLPAKESYACHPAPCSVLFQSHDYALYHAYAVCVCQLVSLSACQLLNRSWSSCGFRDLCMTSLDASVTHPGTDTSLVFLLMAYVNAVHSMIELLPPPLTRRSMRVENTTTDTVTSVSPLNTHFLSYIKPPLHPPLPTACPTLPQEPHPRVMLPPPNRPLQV